MPHSVLLPVLRETVVLLAAAIAVSLVSHRLRLPPIAGLLATGVLIGPSGLAWIAAPEAVEAAAEIGVVLLLFAIGLELSLDRLKEGARAFWVGGGIATAGAAAAAAGLALAFGLPWQTAVLVGFVAAPSSTAVVLKLYKERGELATPHGRTAFGVLLFQDVALVPMLAVVPALGGGGGDSPLALAGRFVLAAILFAAVIWGARRILPHLFDRIARTRARELFLFVALAACFAFAWASEAFGFSLALGAFVAGILVAETDYAVAVEAEIEPFRELFASLFFVAVGMLLDLRAMLAALPMVVVATVGLVAVKLVATAVAVRLLGFPARTVAIVALGLAQLGEFSFVILAAGRGAGLLEGPLYQVLIASSVVTLFVAPMLIAVAPRLAALAPAWLGRRSADGDEAATPTEGASAAPLPTRRDHVILVGYGVGGANVARVLAEASVPFVVLELDAARAARARADGRPVFFGDSTRAETLAAAGLATARVAVFLISDRRAVERSVALARRTRPDLHVVVRARTVAEIEPLRKLGVDEVIAEEFESSIEIFTRVLARYRVPQNVVRAQTRVLRGEDYKMLRVPAGSGVSQAVLDALAAGTSEIVRLEPGSPAIGRSLADLALRRTTGTTVIAVVRDGVSHTNPPIDFELARADALILVGSHTEIESALAQLEPAG